MERMSKRMRQALQTCRTLPSTSGCSPREGTSSEISTFIRYAPDCQHYIPMLRYVQTESGD